MIFYKTVAAGRFQPGVELDTRTYNYGLVSGHRSKGEARLFDEIIRYSELFGFEGLIGIALRWREHSDIPPVVRIKLGPIRTEEFLKLCRRAELPQQNAPTKFWEYLYEKVRKERAPHRPSRVQSVFACRDLESVQRYSAKHRIGSTLCRLELLEGSIFEADMALIDEVGPDWTYTQSLPNIRSYWEGGNSEDPLFEVLVQGRFRMLPLEQNSWPSI